MSQTTFEYFTATCIECGMRAKSFTGHVHIAETQIIAGWCERHRHAKNRPGFPDCTGCHGEWSASDGLVRERQ